MSKDLFTEAVIEKIISERDQIRTQMRQLGDDMDELARFTRKEV